MRLVRSGTSKVLIARSANVHLAVPSFAIIAASWHSDYFVGGWMLLTNADLSSHTINQLLGIVADPGLKHRLDVLDLVNSF